MSESAVRDVKLGIISHGVYDVVFR